MVCCSGEGGFADQCAVGLRVARHVFAAGAAGSPRAAWRSRAGLRRHGRRGGRREPQLRAGLQLPGGHVPGLRRRRRGGLLLAPPALDRGRPGSGLPRALSGAGGLPRGPRRRRGARGRGGAPPARGPGCAEARRGGFSRGGPVSPFGLCGLPGRRAALGLVAGAPRDAVPGLSAVPPAGLARGPRVLRRGRADCAGEARR
mmetsp:Transcript_64872/g.193321  ORF Transcript_64872/g.193321 Transcript_64872/m.193321 type:complete len:201 (-) Transcript_64872:307-909(-)